MSEWDTVVVRGDLGDEELGMVEVTLGQLPQI